MLLFKPAFLFFLITHIHAYHFFIYSYGINTIAVCPKMAT